MTASDIAILRRRLNEVLEEDTNQIVTREKVLSIIDQTHQDAIRYFTEKNMSDDGEGDRIISKLKENADKIAELVNSEILKEDVVSLNEGILSNFKNIIIGICALIGLVGVGALFAKLYMAAKTALAAIVNLTAVIGSLVAGAAIVIIVFLIAYISREIYKARHDSGH